MTAAKKILFTTQNTSWGGSELLWAKTAIELASQGHDIAICVHSKLQLPDWLEQQVSAKSITCYKLPVQPLPAAKRILNKFLPYRQQFRPKDYRQSFIQQYSPNLLVINQGLNFNAVDTMAFAARLGYHYVTISHAVNEALWPNQKLREKMSYGFGNARQNYFVSADNLAVTESQLAQKLNNAVIVRNPFYVPYQTNLAYPPTERFALACVGRFDCNAKGQDILLRVLASDKWKGRALQVNFYGDGQDTENLKSLIAYYGLDKAVIHPHTPPTKIWENNHGLILASRYEGLPIVIVEAMLCARLVIATDVSGNSELIQDGVSGFLASAPRVNPLDHALERAWEVRGNWQVMGEKARESIVKEIPENPAAVLAGQLIQWTDAP